MNKIKPLQLFTKFTSDEFKKAKELRDEFLKPNGEVRIAKKDCKWSNNFTVPTNDWYSFSITRTGNDFCFGNKDFTIEMWFTYNDLFEDNLFLKRRFLERK